MGRKKNRGSHKEYSYEETSTVNSEDDEEKRNFAARLLASMGVNDNPTSESVPEEPLEDTENNGEDFQTKHPHLSSIHHKFKKVFGRDSDSESEGENDSARSKTQSKHSKSESAGEATMRLDLESKRTSGSAVEEAADSVTETTVASTEISPETTDNSNAKPVEPTKEPQTSANEVPAPKKKRNRRKEKLAEREKERIKMVQDATDEANTAEDKRLIELKGMGMMIASAGLVEFEVQPDGHCLFHSLCDQLEVRKGIRTDVQALRTTLANFIRDHPDDFIPYMLDEETGALRDINDYTKELETTPLWGGDLEIMAASRVYETPIRIHFSSQMPLDIAEPEYAANDPFHLAFYQAKFGLGAHYNSLRDGPKEANTSA